MVHSWHDRDRPNRPRVGCVFWEILELTCSGYKACVKKYSCSPWKHYLKQFNHPGWYCKYCKPLRPHSLERWAKYLFGISMKQCIQWLTACIIKQIQSLTLNHSSAFVQIITCNSPTLTCITAVSVLHYAKGSAEVFYIPAASGTGTGTTLPTPEVVLGKMCLMLKHHHHLSIKYLWFRCVIPL